MGKNMPIEKTLKYYDFYIESSVYSFYNFPRSYFGLDWYKSVQASHFRV